MKRLALILMVCLIAGACGKSDEIDRKKTFPVAGIVQVDGKPVADIAVTCQNVDGIDQDDTTLSAAFTDKDGRFEISTYEKGDGVPEGDYVLTFKMGKMNMVSMQYQGDQFKGKYADPKTSAHKFTIDGNKLEEGKPMDLGSIELTSK